MDDKQIFAAISDENGILEYADAHSDLEDAMLAYAQQLLCEPLAAEHMEGLTWYEFSPSATGWQDWAGGMDGGEYDAMIAAAEHRYSSVQTGRAVQEAIGRLRAM